MASDLLVDGYNRPLKNLRISVTQRCNLNCFFCHREGDPNSEDREMAADEIITLVRVAASFGAAKIKITGGEPLLRGDVADIIGGLCSINGIEEVSMTTCGMLLPKVAGALREAGLKRVNINFPTLKRERYKKITGEDLLDEVIHGVESAISAGLRPVKLNMVLLSRVNDDEVQDMIDFTSGRDVILQIIELIPPANASGFYDKYHRDLDDIAGALRSKATKVVSRRMHARKVYFLKNGSAVEIVKPMHNTEFCLNCTRLRITSDGRLKPCLMRDDNYVDVLTPLRSGASEEELRELFKEANQLREPYWLVSS